MKSVEFLKPVKQTQKILVVSDRLYYFRFFQKNFSLWINGAFNRLYDKFEYDRVYRAIKKGRL